MGSPLFLSVPCLGGNERKYILDCLDSEWVSSSGKYVYDFERAFAAYIGMSDAVACVSGTAALHTCLVLAGIQPDEEVIVPTLTFIAPVNAVKYAFAEPVFMDCDDYLNMDMGKLERFLAEECSFDGERLINNATGKRIRAVIPVHVFGSMCDMDKLMSLAETYRLSVIEDSTEALGSRMVSGRFAGRRAGTIGDFGTFSFNGNKIITCGGGGMIVARDAEMSRRAKYLTTQAKSDGPYYIHDEIGYNYRLTAIAAAMGLAQLEQLPEFIRLKKNRYVEYQDGVKDIPGLSILDTPSYGESNYWFYSLLIDSTVYGIDRDPLMEKLAAENIQTRPIWRLNHLQKPYLSNQAYRVDKATEYVKRVLNIPCSAGLTDADVARVLDALTRARRAS